MMEHEGIYQPSQGKFQEVDDLETRRQIGQELRSAREFQNLTLEQVRATTKINIRYLEDLEQGDWSFLPPTYVKAFLKAYAGVIGKQSEELNERLDELFASVLSGSQFPKAHPAQGETFIEEGAGTPPSILVWAERNRSMVFYGVITIAVIILMIFYLTRPSQPPIPLEERNELIEEAPVAEAEEDTTAPAIASESPVEPEPPVVETMRLDVFAVDTCYLKIAHNDSLIYERTLWPGNRLRRELPKPIKLSLGNAPGVRILVDGDTLRLPSRRRVQVLNFGAND